MTGDEHVLTLALCNKTQKDLYFFVEPEATRYRVPPETTFQIVFRSASGGIPQIDVLKDDFIAVWAFSGCRYQVFHEGKEMQPS